MFLPIFLCADHIAIHRYFSAMSASRHALLGYFDSLRSELCDAGITVTTAIVEPSSKLSNMDQTVKHAATTIITAVANCDSEIYVGSFGNYTLTILRTVVPGIYRKIVARRAVQERGTPMPPPPAHLVIPPHLSFRGGFGKVNDTALHTLKDKVM